MVLYALLHLSGFSLPMEQFKASASSAPTHAGHPEIDHRLGIEMTTGPLGQGFGSGVGMAIVETHLRARLGPELVDHRIFGFVSDGDLMEGISAESSSLAGHLGLDRLIYFYDDNDISIDGDSDITFSEDVGRRFGAVGWHVSTVDVGGRGPALAVGVSRRHRRRRPHRPGHRPGARVTAGRG